MTRPAVSAFAIVLLVGVPAAAEAPRNGLPPGPGPVVVEAGFRLFDINEVEVETETFEFEGVLTLRWHDPRLAFDPEALGVAERVYQGNFQFSEVFDGWWPQVVLSNESGAASEEGVVLRVQPDGTAWLLQKFDAVAESPMALRRFPFDEQRLEARFRVLGYGSDEVRLEAPAEASGLLPEGDDPVGTAAWRVDGFEARAEDSPSVVPGPDRIAAGSGFRVSVNASRRAGYMLRSVVGPLMLLVVLSWSVFWMDRSSLGERMDISFIALLTVVAFQIMVEQSLPDIPYFTVMSGFLLANYSLLAASVVVNLRVDFLDRQGRSNQGDAIDLRCRWAFPLIYLGGMPALLAVYAAAV